jgi:hypothetical protein
LINKYKEIYDFCGQIDPNELSPKEALDILYKLKNLLIKNQAPTFP